MTLGVWFSVVAVALLAAVVPAAAQFSVTPVIVELVTGDSAATRNIQVRNEGSEELQLRFYAGDFEQDSLGEHQFMPPGSLDRSCSERLHLFPEGATLDPAETVNVVVRLEPGTRSCWSVVFAESLQRSTQGLSVARRIAVKVYGGGWDGSREAEVTAVQVDEGAQSLVLAVRNTGERAFVATGDVEIRSMEGAVMATVPIEDFSVLPGRHRRVSVELGARLDPGRYLAIPVVDFGGDYLAGGQALFEVPSPDP